MHLVYRLSELAQTGDVRVQRVLRQTRELAEAICLSVGDRRFLQPLIEAGINNQLDLATLKAEAERKYLCRTRLAELLESYR